jgi:hypothetical protein
VGQQRHEHRTREQDREHRAALLRRQRVQRGLEGHDHPQHHHARADRHREGAGLPACEPAQEQPGDGLHGCRQHRAGRREGEQRGEVGVHRRSLQRRAEDVEQAGQQRAGQRDDQR